MTRISSYQDLNLRIAPTPWISDAQFQPPRSGTMALARLLLFSICAFVAGAHSVAQAGEAIVVNGSPAAIEFFERQVRPVLFEHCQKCHGEKKQEAGLRLDSRAALVHGSDNGQVFVPTNPHASKLLVAINYADKDLQMPPDGKLPKEAIETLTHWVELGLPWGEDTVARTVDPKEDVWKHHWAFRPITQPALPAVDNADWVQSPIDQFILAKLRAAETSPAKPADRRALLRRVSFDLIGLPPTAEEIDSFVADRSADALAKVVDRLLASPQYGERWGRHWLDYARYADTKGYLFTSDRKYPNAYKYRDWVVRALNEDLPYDQFLIQQIAADRLPISADKNTLAALGFLAVGRRFLNNTADIIDDRLDVLCRTTMGLTISCARCHDHKYDPIASQDYYSLYGIFASTVEPDEPGDLMTMADSREPHNARVFIRGNPKNLGLEVPRRFLPLLADGKYSQPITEGSGRLELAQAIANKDNPLTSRVLVNRVWQHFFGEGLVRTPSDFGLRSELPTHPELLDYLAFRFMDEGWSLKKLHRWIVLSSTYQQSSDDNAEHHKRDPDNRLVWRMNRRRLDLEATRDALLAVAGSLDRTIGGPSVDLTTEPFSERRTLYGYIDRQNLPGMFRTFDFALPDTHSPQRFSTTVPQQALYLMNSPFAIEQAKRLAAREEVQSLTDPQARVSRLYQLALGRQPTEREAQLAIEFIRSVNAGNTASLDVWSQLAQTLLMSNEFAYLD